MFINNGTYSADIENLVDSMRQNRLSVFCGSGATADVTKTTWGDLFKKELNIIDKNDIDYYRIAQYYELHFGRKKLLNSISNTFSKKQNSIHVKHLLKLPIYDFWTTNYDTIIEDMIEEKIGIKPSVIYNSENIIKINENKKYKVFKMNGSILDSNSMILTTDDFKTYFSKQKLLIEFLKRELVLNTFLFIGYSFNDNLILDCLSELNNCFPTLNHYHYRIDIMDKNNRILQDVESKYFENTYKIKTIYVDDYDDIDAFLNTLYDEYKSKNVFISGSFRNIAPSEEDRANEICKELVNSLIDNDYNIFSGDGKRLGSYVITNATKKLIEHETGYLQSKLRIMPYIDHSFKSKRADDPERLNLVNAMINDCKIAIFLYGQSENNDPSEGVYSEFLEARKRDMITIPIPTTNYASKKIFDYLIKNNNIPWFLERGFAKKLSDANSPREIGIVIMEILNYISNR